MSTKQRCPICRVAVRPNREYPRYVCRRCAERVRSADDRPIEFFNRDLSGGFVGRYVDTQKAYRSHECFIDGVRCHADEARFGGIVVQAMQPLPSRRTRTEASVGRFPQPQGAKGSLRWIQHLVNRHPDVLQAALDSGPVQWRSPLSNDGYAEYRDQAFLDRLDITLPRRQLKAFWPSGGPQWDALGRARSGEVILVEAKAHLPELLSPPTQASEASLQTIRASLLETAKALKASPGTDWSKRFYQYANRLAHAWFLADVNGLPVRLAFLHFIGDVDMDGPSTRREWEAALTVLHEALGLRGRLPRYVAEIFIDVRPAVPTVA